MADITVTKARPCTVVGYEVVDAVELASAVVAGDLLVFTGTVNGGMAVMDKAAVGATDVHAIALKDGYAGQRGFDVGLHGEMDGFSGLTAGTKLYRSGDNAGKIGTTSVATQQAQIKAVTDTRIRYLFC